MSKPPKSRLRKITLNHQKIMLTVLLYSFCFLCRIITVCHAEEDVPESNLAVDNELQAESQSKDSHEPLDFDDKNIEENLKSSLDLIKDLDEQASKEEESESTETEIDTEIESDQTKTVREQDKIEEGLPFNPVWNKNKKYTLQELESLYDHEAGLPANPPGLVNAYAWALLLSGENYKQNLAYKMFLYLANDYGLPAAQHAMAFMYMNGIGLVDLSGEREGGDSSSPLPPLPPSKISQAQYLSKSITYQTFASLGGDELAQQTLAYQYLTGHGMKKDCEKALIYYEQSAKAIFEREKANVLYTLSNRHKDVLSKYQVQIAEYEDPTVETAAEMDEAAHMAERISFQEMKAVNDPEELLQIGQYYLNGLFGMQRNLAKAESAFSRVPKDNKAYGMAQAFLGKIFIDGGDGIESDYERAKEHLDRALTHGSAVAKAYYGILYLYGWGVTKNIEEAKRLFEDSSKAGWYDASLHLGQMYYDGVYSSVQGAKNHQHAMRHFSKAAQYGSIIARYYLGIMHAKGQGTARHCVTAVSYFRLVVEQGGSNSLHLWKKAFNHYKEGDFNAALTHYLYLADLGFDVAQLNAADMIHARRAFVEEDGKSYLKRSKFNWERASQDGNSVAAKAILNLGDYYYYDEKDYEKAIESYRLNSERHECAQSSFNLGYMHHYGIGLPKDYHLAKRYYDKSEETEKSGAIPIFLALTKLVLDISLIKFSSKIDGLTNINLNVITEYLYSIEAGTFENWLLKYLGRKYDIIIGTVMVFLTLFGVAWRRQNRLLYERTRMDEILRLEEVAGEENSNNINSGNQNEEEQDPE